MTRCRVGKGGQPSPSSPSSTRSNGCVGGPTPYSSWLGAVPSAELLKLVGVWWPWRGSWSAVSGQKTVPVQPLAAVMQQARHWMVRGTPGTAAWMGGSVWLLAPLGIVVAACVLGYWVLNRMAPQIAEEL